MARRPTGTHLHFLLPTVLPDLSINWTTASGFRDDIHETWEAIRCVNFDFNYGGFEADNSAGINFG
jgi:hypothetical protein